MCSHDNWDGYKKPYHAFTSECLFYGEMSQRCLKDGEACPKPWNNPNFKAVEEDNN